MRTALLAAIMAAAALPGAGAGTITGMVGGQGPPAEEGNAASGGVYSSKRYLFAQKVDYEHLADFVVWIDQDLPGPAPPPGRATVEQHDVSFNPHVLAIVKGTVVRWPNRDAIYHNVFSMSDPAPFDLGMHTADEKAPEIPFDKEGRVDVFCSIHSQMHCIVLVLPNRFFAKVDSGRRYRIADVPAGTYRLKAWHERLPPKVVEHVTVPAQGEVTVDFKLGLSELPRY